MIRPVPLQQDPGKAHQHPGNERSKRSRHRPEPAVKPAEDHRAAAPQPHGTHDRNKQLNIIQLGHKAGTGQKNKTDHYGNDPDDADMHFGRQIFPAERQHTILRNSDTGTVNAAVIR